MLVLTRKIGETVCIGEDIEVTVTQVKGKQVRLAFKADRKIKIIRKEIVKNAKPAAATNNK